MTRGLLRICRHDVTETFTTPDFMIRANFSRKSVILFPELASRSNVIAA
jgi:hypothetical protein